MSDPKKRLAYALAGMPEGTPEDLKPVYGLLAPAPNTEYGSMPWSMWARDTQTGETRMAMPSMVREGLLGMADLLGGTSTGNVTPRGMESITMGSLGAGVSMAPRGAMAMGGAKPFKAYHGSPHDFDKFDLSKIGTGEGAQAYGHGLYFAENEKVAKQYRDALSTRPDAPSTVLVGPDGRQLDILSAPGELSAIRGMRDEISYDQLLKDAQANLDRAAGLRNPQLRDPQVRRAQDAVDWLRSNNGVAFTANPERGRMYEVNIHADPARFLDWDKPLFKQGEIGKIAGDVADKIHGPNFLYNSSMGVANAPGIVKTPEFSAAAREAGIPGIRYLDGGSRTAGDGSRNTVVFDDSIVEILRKYGLLAPAPVASAPSPEEGKRRLRGLLAEREY